MKFAVLTLFVTSLSASIVLADAWPQFRGPTGRGHSDAKNLPTSWGENGVAWKTSLPGEGQSSPVVWGDQIFLTAASDGGRARHVFALSAQDGAIIWQETVSCESPEEIHKMNSHATPSCATDGQSVVAFLGTAGLFCFTVDGKMKWKAKIATIEGSWGIAASPIIVDGKVIQNCDSAGRSHLVALDLETGEIVWNTHREDKPRGGWSTPIVIEHEGKKELVLNGEFGVRGYDLESGKELWFCEGFNGRGSPVPEFSDGKLFVVNGKPGDTYCVKPGGRGNVTNSHRVWHAPRKGGRDLPSPAVVGDFLFITSMSGIASVYRKETGEVLWTERLSDLIEAGDGALEIAAAPFVANGLIYLPVVAGGDVIVLRPGEKPDVVSMNTLGDAAAAETFRSTLSPMDDGLLIRSNATLYFVKAT